MCQNSSTPSPRMTSDQTARVWLATHPDNQASLPRPEHTGHTCMATHLSVCVCVCVCKSPVSPPNVSELLPALLQGSSRGNTVVSPVVKIFSPTAATYVAISFVSIKRFLLRSSCRLMNLAFKMGPTIRRI